MGKQVNFFRRPKGSMVGRNRHEINREKVDRMDAGIDIDLCRCLHCCRFNGTAENAANYRGTSVEGLSSVKKIVFPDDTRRIESRAFANSSLEEVYLPDSVEYIAEDAFEGCENLMFLCPGAAMPTSGCTI